MGVREWANEHPKVVGGVVGACVLLGVGAAVIQAVNGRRGYPSHAPNSYFSSDDGKTWFVETSDHYAPFDHGGQTAVGAYVFQCGGKKFVGYLERYLPDAKQKLDAGSPLTPAIVRYGREVKRPGDAAWTRTGDIAVEAKVEDVPCPDGAGGSPEAIEP